MDELNIAHGLDRIVGFPDGFARNRKMTAALDGRLYEQWVRAVKDLENIEYESLLYCVCIIAD